LQAQQRKVVSAKVLHTRRNVVTTPESERNRSMKTNPKTWQAKANSSSSKRHWAEDVLQKRLM